MANTGTSMNSAASTALQRIAENGFEVAFTEYQRQLAAYHELPKPHDFSKGNPLNALDEAHAALMETPAPDFPALLRKMEAVSGDMVENMGWEAQYFIDDLIADFRRLLGSK